MDINWEQAEAWSLLDSRPVLFYNSHYDDWFVCWKGVRTTGKLALLIASMLYLKVSVTPEMQRNALIHFTKLYYANAFDTIQWNGNILTDKFYAYKYRLIRNRLKGEMPFNNEQEVLLTFEKMLLNIKE